jgi:carbamoyl-phosphate synthase large subunit
MAKKVNILLTSVGRRMELVRAFKQAYSMLGVNGDLVAVDCSPLAPALYETPIPYVVPRLDHPDYIPTLARICERHQIDAVFPLIDPDIGSLSANQQVFSILGTKLAVVDMKGVGIVRDKFKTAAFFLNLGLKTPASWAPKERLGKYQFPVFIKPRDGSSSKYTFKVESAKHLEFFETYVPDPIIQEFIDGPEITVDVLNDMDGKFITSVARRRIEVRSGEVLKGVTVFNQQINDDCRKISESLAAPGPITVQCMIQGDEIYYTEINARFGGGAPLGIASGVHYPAIILSRLAGLPMKQLEPGRYKQGLFVSRFDDAIFIDEQKRVEMAGRNI